MGPWASSVHTRFHRSGGQDRIQARKSQTHLRIRCRCARRGNVRERRTRGETQCHMSDYPTPKPPRVQKNHESRIIDLEEGQGRLAADISETNRVLAYVKKRVANLFEKVEV